MNLQGCCLLLRPLPFAGFSAFCFGVQGLVLPFLLLLFCVACGSPPQHMRGDEHLLRDRM